MNQLEAFHLIERISSEARLQRAMATRQAKDAATQAVNYPFQALEAMNKAAQYAHTAEVLERILAGC
jgi:hypothetical protein